MEGWSLEISIHSLRMEGDINCNQQRLQGKHFNPLPPHGGRRQHRGMFTKDRAFQSTPSAWRETCQVNAVCSAFHISIHSLRMEGDVASLPSVGGDAYFNPLPPHGGRQTTTVWIGREIPFQSTPSAWRETERIQLDLQYCGFQSTPSAWRETICAAKSLFRSIFQSTPSAWRETPVNVLPNPISWYFNPLPPHGGRLFNFNNSGRRNIISIHSLRMEGDSSVRKIIFRRCHFNPLPPHGGRQVDGC